MPDCVASVAILIKVRKETRPKIEATVIVKIAVYIAALALAPNNSSSVDVVSVISRRFKIKIERNTPKAITKTMP